MKITLNSKEINIKNNQFLMESLKEKNIPIPGMCKIKEDEPFGSCRLCLVDVNGKIMPSCAYTPQENDKIASNSPTIYDMRKTALELMLSNHTGDCIGHCQEGCPADGDVQGYVALIANKKYHEAVQLMKEKYILAASLGRICPAFCEDNCRRQKVDDSLAIRQIKRFAADFDLNNNPWMPEIPEETGKKVAIIGGGPAGLSCAYYLRIKGHSPTIFEAMPKLGGMLRYGIPEYRLPKDILDKDIATVTNTGINIKTNTKLGKDFSLKDLQNEFDSIFIATGAWKSRSLNIEGKDLPGIMDGIDFLQKINSNQKVHLGKKVIVVGGGNSAIDVVRTARRLGSDVTLCYRRSRSEMPANVQEIKEAEEEGINLNLLTNPTKIFGTDHVEKVELIKMELGELDKSGRRRPIPIKNSNYTIDCDNIIFAIGQMGEEEVLNISNIQNRRGRVNFNEMTFETNLPGVFTGGDLALGPSTVIESITTGRDAASFMHLYLQGKLELAKSIIQNPIEHFEEIEQDVEIKKLFFKIHQYNHWKEVTEEDLKDYEKIERVKAKLAPPEQRILSFNEVEPTLSEEEISKETQRCLSCGCSDSFDCKLREYSTIYQAKQDIFEGEVKHFEIDKSSPLITFDRNKCILCGKCGVFTQDQTGEGILYFQERGFDTHMAPEPNINLGDFNTDYLMNFLDICPVGAFTEKLNFVKPGPWDTTSIPSVCNECGMGCGMNIETYANLPIKVSAKKDSWNGIFLCNRPRVNRKWESKQEPNINNSLSLDSIKKTITEHLDDLAIILTPEITNEEITEVMSFAKLKGVKIGGIYRDGISTAKISDIASSKRIKIDANIENYPYLKILLFEAQKQGTTICDENYDLLITENYLTPTDIPTLILHKGVNEIGLIKAKVPKVPVAKNYLILGNCEMKLNGFMMVMGKCQHSDLTIPSLSWMEHSGTIINFANEVVEMKKVGKGLDLLDHLKQIFP
ncbi:MAG: FAD-dependent oxidoreductase [Promethearchaeota archaeon]